MLALAHSIVMLFLARMVDGLSGGNISTARAYVADVTEPKDRVRAYGLIGAAFGLGFIFGPALSGVLSKVSYTAPIWAAAALTLVATIMAWAWLPETVHRVHASAGNPLRYLPELLRRPIVRQILGVDFVFWFALAIFQTTFSLFVAARFGFDAETTGYVFAGFGLLGVIVQGGFIRPIVRRIGDKQTFIVGLVFGAIGLAAAAVAQSVMLFLLALVPLSLGMGFGMPTISSLVSQSAGAHEQGRVQGAASAIESLSRTLGPVWGAALLQRYGAASPYLSAALFFVVALLMAARSRVAGARQVAATEA
jgi:MFS transporter, DHA1 family, tetracycline resistance protein